MLGVTRTQCLPWFLPVPASSTRTCETEQDTFPIIASSSRWGYTALLCAVKKSQTGTVAALLKAGAKIEHEDRCQCQCQCFSTQFCLEAFWVSQSHVCLTLDTAALRSSLHPGGSDKMLIFQCSKYSRWCEVSSLEVCHPRHIGGNSDKVNKRFWSRLGGTSTTGIDLETLHWAWQKCNVSHLSLSLYHLCARYNHPEVVTILEENGAMDCNWPPHSIIRGVELKTSAAQCYSLMWSQHCIFIFPFDLGPEK